MTRPAATLGLALAYAAFVVYGSLVPLDFHPLDWDEAWARFQHIPFLHLGLESRADWVANGVLYAPLGFLLTRAGCEHRWPPAVALLLSALLGCAMAVGVEFTQLWFPQRTVSLNDILAECIGSVLGAAVAPAFTPWLDRLGQGLRSGGSRLLPRLLEAYAVVYLLLCFFPYDLLLSATEVQGKWEHGGWGWWLAPGERSLFLVGLQWLVELALAMPMGALRGLRTDGPAALRASPATIGRAAGAGLLLGLFIEVGQFFVSSGISQGASVLSRGLGVAAGAALLPWLRSVGWDGVRAALRPWVAALWVVYVPLLAGASGLFRHGWHGSAEAWASWQSTHLLPFYYHYFTTEALAMFSLGSVALMYAPVAALAWLRGRSLAWAAAVAAALSLLIEFAKLYLDETHADPTNVLVAVATNLLLMALLGRAQRVAVEPAVEAAQRSPAAGGPASYAGLLALPAAALWAAGYPAFPVALLVLLGLAAVLTARWPLLALGLVPAALPVLDLAPWSGRFFLDEFDLLQAVALAVAFSRSPPVQGQPRSRALLLVMSALALSLGLSTVRALMAAGWPDANSFNSYYSPYNALRILKGALWAGLYLMLWRRLSPCGQRRNEVLSNGLLIGLALTVLFVFWERLVFAGLWDFGADFRVTGPFSAMHKGGAYIECFLAVGAAFALARTLQPGPVPVRAAAAVLLAGTAYAMMVTYSRNGYAALAVVAVVTLVFAARGWVRAAASWRLWAGGAVALVLLAVIALPIAGGSYARQRLAKSGEDLALRQAHWADGLALRDGSLLTSVLGMGLGRFPQAHYWRSVEPVHAASYGLVQDPPVPGQSEPAATHLRLAQGATLYIEQIVPRPEIGALKLSLDLRAGPGAQLPTVSLCEKWTLTSLGCATLVRQPSAAAAAAASGAASAPTSAGGWQHIEWAVDASRLLARPAPWRAPLKLSLMTPQAGVVDVKDVQLNSALGDSLLLNGDFGHGLDHWFFATDVDPPWHLHSLPVAVLFDQGWLGVLAWLALLGLAVVRGARHLWLGQAQVPAALPAVLGFVTSGLLNTLIDAPRFLWLLLVLLALAAARLPLDRAGRAGAPASAAP